MTYCNKRTLKVNEEVGKYKKDVLKDAPAVSIAIDDQKPEHWKDTCPLLCHSLSAREALSG